MNIVAFLRTGGFPMLITCTCKSAVCFPVVTMYLIILLYILVLSNFLFFYLTEEPDETGTRDVRL